MKKIYFYIFFCFHSLLLKEDPEKLEGANTFLSFIWTSVIFSLYFWIHIWFNLKFYYPKIEALSLFSISITVWLINRNYFLKKGNGLLAINLNDDKNETIGKTLGILLLVGQLALFIYSGISTSSYVKNF